MTENKFPIGSEVFTKVNPDITLIISQYLKSVYYNIVKDHPLWRGLVYHERELIPILAN
ncbi:hypothetical protein [Pontibacter harenae]|uniref:hypothetical protein n=1 Tax=Pontibacter harenae TaxID=2894083 RepID=UPI001E3739A1|nr:hypothetical protein [Pontibacter harenae]MCC9168092.1 hypothetical protein [Pontibacter harenae]